MAIIFTKTTELSVAFGLLGVDPLESTYDNIVDRFVESLDRDTYDAVIKELGNSKKAKIYEKLQTVGHDIRRNHLNDKPVSKIEWMGLYKQRKSVSVSKDLCIDGQLFVSVKSDSNVVFNLSPYNLLQTLPTGSPMAGKEINWFLQTAPEKYDELYPFIRDSFQGSSKLPLTVAEFDKSVSKTTREEVQKWLANLNSGQKVTFEGLYVAMCHAVAEKSSALFLENRRNIKKSQLNAANEMILKFFLRLNSTPYILAGLEGGKPFAVEVPDITKWFRHWNFTEITARADTDRNQCVVDFVLKLTSKENSKVVELPYHAEIRWSHGKFCGNPEGKLYKDFKWKDVPFFKKVI